MAHRGVWLQVPVTRKKGGEQARLDFARSLNAWEIQKEHVFLDGFVALAQAYAKFFQSGCGAVKGMERLVEDMQQHAQLASSREVRSFFVCLLLCSTARHP